MNYPKKNDVCINKMVQKTEYKIRLHKFCIEIINKRISAARQFIENAQANANSEEKSSAGDKYETSRAMSHLEKDMHSRQLLANQNELVQLLQVNILTMHTYIAIGSIVACGELVFFIAAGLGKISFEGKIIYLVSPNAPVAKLMMSKTAGSKILFNNKELVVDEVF